jgi:hypothetical protein
MLRRRRDTSLERAGLGFREVRIREDELPSVDRIDGDGEFIDPAERGIGSLGRGGIIEDLLDELGLELEDFLDVIDGLGELGLGDFGQGVTGGLGRNGRRGVHGFGSGNELSNWLGWEQGMVSDAGGYGGSETPTPLDTQWFSADPRAGNPLPGRESGGANFEVTLPAGSGSYSSADETGKAGGDVTVGAVLTIPFGDAPKAVKPTPQSSETDRKERDVKPTQKNPSAVEQGVDAPKKTPGTGTARPNPHDERRQGPLTQAALKKLREFAPPSSKSDSPLFGGGSAPGGRVGRLAINWELVRGGGVTDPMPYGSAGRYGPRRPANISKMRPRGPASDDPSVYGTLGSAGSGLEFAGESLDDDSD